MGETDLLECVAIEPRGEARSAVIWLHGLGADGNDFPPIIPMLGLPDSLGIRWIFPNAPVRPVTLNFGMRMRAWYDVSMLDEERHYPEEDILEATRQIEALIARERARGIPARRIVLVGFSQGGAIAMHTALRHAERLAGLGALSTYLVRGDALDEEAADANRDLPVFMAHGTHDPMVKYRWAEAARDRLVALGYPVEFESYPMEHQVVQEEVDDLGAFLGRCLATEDAE
ncbi:MAG: dienelactone hydrolase family protein [Planctomycetota bacterium]